MIPQLWKLSKIIPILKAATEGKSYCSISLLSSAAKVLESLLLPSVKEHCPLASHQHGYKEGNNIATALNMITRKIANDLNQQRPCQRIIVAASDLSRFWLG